MTNEQSCKLCGETRRLVRAHIIPESFFRDAQIGEEALHLIGGPNPRYARRSPIGVYDKNLVCAFCERLFGPWDTYAADLLINRRNAAFKPLLIDGRMVPAQVADPYDYEKLRMFVLSLLWRAGASSQPFFRRITLPVRIERLRDLIRNGDLGRQSEFRTVFARWELDAKWPESGLIADPYEYRSNQGPRMLRAYLGVFTVDVQVDDMPPVPAHEHVCMARDRPLYSLLRPLRGSRDLYGLEPVIADWVAGLPSGRIAR